MPVIINGTTGISGVDGSAGTPAFQGSDANTGIRFGTDIVSLVTSGSDRLYIDSSGKLGVGTSSPAQSWTGGASQVLQLQGPAATITVLRINESGGTYGDLQLVSSGSAEVGVYNFSNGAMRFGTNGTERLRIDSSGRVGIGTASPGSELVVTKSSGNVRLTVQGGTNGDGTVALAGAGTGIGKISFWDQLAFGKSSAGAGDITTEYARIDNSGRLLVGTSSARSNFYNVGASAALQLEGLGGFGDSRRIAVISSDASSTAGGGLVLAHQRSGTVGGNTIVQNGDSLGLVSYQGNDGTDFVEAAIISCQVDGTPGANDMPGRLVFSTTADGASSPTERMRISQNGRISLDGNNQTEPEGNTATNGITFNCASGSHVQFAKNNGAVAGFNRMQDDGTIIRLLQAGTEEGTISVSGTTVSYNGAHLSRWSQLPSGAERIEILRGTVLSNIDEMCEWGEEENEQLNRMKVSDVEGDKNVSGVFQAWDDDDDTYTNDFYCAMTGDFIIRIGAGVTVERGDLLMSAGDGTAKPQEDDIIRSKTIAKVTSTNVSCTYDDGSYCVPCVLMAC